VTAITSMWLSAALALAGVIVFLWGTEVAGAAPAAWNRAKAQAAAEHRRLADTAREARAGAASAGGGLRSAFSAARQAAGALRSGMRGPRAGATPGSRVPPGSGAAGRIGRAAFTGASLGARRAARAAKAAAARRPKSRGWRRPGQGRWQRPGRARPPRVPLGVCDNCGVIVARASLKPATVQRPGGPQKWKLCVPCRKRREAVDAPAPGTPAPSLNSAHAAADAVPGAQVPAGALPQQSSAEPLPGTDRDSLRPGGSDGAALPPGMPAAPRPSLTQGANVMPPSPITAGRPSGAVARRAAASPAIARDSRTHGGWTANVEQVIAALIFIGQCKQAMIAALKDANASESQIRDIQAWADHLDSAQQAIRAGLLSIDRRLEPHINAIEIAGGVNEVADAGYHSDY
jgi:hypothetical protein